MQDNLDGCPKKFLSFFLKKTMKSYKRELNSFPRKERDIFYKKCVLNIF